MVAANDTVSQLLHAVSNAGPLWKLGQQNERGAPLGVISGHFLYYFYRVTAHSIYAVYLLGAHLPCVKGRCPDAMH